MRIGTVAAMEIEEDSLLQQEARIHSLRASASVLGAIPQGCCPAEGQAVRVVLKGGVRSDLNWNDERACARDLVKRGFLIFWEMDLGLFDGLAFPLADPGQFSALQLALFHFRDSLWKEFEASSIGLCLYRGNADFSVAFPWNEEEKETFNKWLLANAPGQSQNSFFIREFCTHAVFHYLNRLLLGMPDSIPCYLLLDLSVLPGDPLTEARLLHPDRCERFCLGLRGNKLPWEAWEWQQDSRLLPPSPSQAQVGLCLPSIALIAWPGIQEKLIELLAHGVPFRLMNEEQLLHKWDGLDSLIVLFETVSPEGKRKLKGFEAAGGSVEWALHF